MTNNTLKTLTFGLDTSLSSAVVRSIQASILRVLADEIELKGNNSDCIAVKEFPHELTILFRPLYGGKTL
jgi:hypothetical protein